MLRFFIATIFFHTFHLNHFNLVWKFKFFITEVFHYNNIFSYISVILFRHSFAMNYQKQEQVVLERSARLKIHRVHMACWTRLFCWQSVVSEAQTCPNIKRPIIYLFMGPSAAAFAIPSMFCIWVVYYEAEPVFLVHISCDRQIVCLREVFFVITLDSVTIAHQACHHTLMLI